MSQTDIWMDRSIETGQGLATNQFVARLLQPTTWQLIRLSTYII
jgi:hypothetical protein